MIDPALFSETLTRLGFEYFTGVPDSLLKDFCGYLEDRVDPACHVIAANEGNAIALAAGHYLGTNRPAFIYMQNSGIGNAINPLLSLADPEVYAIPMLVMVGWRGEPGGHDEPQHVKQGKIMENLLDSLGIPWVILDANTSDPMERLKAAATLMAERSAPVVLLVRAGTFSKFKAPGRKGDSLPFSREEAIRVIVERLPTDVLVISTTGKASRELYELRVRQGQEANDFLTVGSMGHASSIALGLATAQPERKVVCLDGDGAALMHLGGMAIIGVRKPGNLLHVLLNNGAHESVGGQPTVGFSIQFPRIAESMGYERCAVGLDASSLAATVDAFLQDGGTTFLEVRVGLGAREELGRPKSTPLENRVAFMKKAGSI